VIFGEVGLGGEIRAVGQAGARLKEAEKLGFRHAITPARRRRKGRDAGRANGVEIREVSHIGDLLTLFDADPRATGALAAI
jgi:DNA repair protein RadA/Sms